MSHNFPAIFVLTRFGFSHTLFGRTVTTYVLATTIFYFIEVRRRKVRRLSAVYFPGRSNGIQQVGRSAEGQRERRKKGELGWGRHEGLQPQCSGVEVSEL